MIIMIMAGIWAIKSIPSQLDPPLAYPLVWVEATWPGASAEDVEELITLPIEHQIRTIPKLNRTFSRSIDGYVRIGAQFDFDADMTQALDQVKQRVAAIRNLPPDIETPSISRILDREPIARLLVSGGGDISELIPVVRNMEKDLMNLGIEGVEYDGLPIEEIALLVSSQTLYELGLTLDDLSRQISSSSQNVPAGTIGRGQGSRRLRSLDQQRDPLGFEQIYIESQDQLLPLGSISKVVRRAQDGQPSISRYGQPTIEMFLWRTTEADAYQAHVVLDKWLEENRDILPEGVEIHMAEDIWDLLGAQIDLIVNNGGTGLILVVLTLFLFLNGRVGFWVMMGIPVSFLLALALLHGYFGFGMSIIAMIGFIMALGIVVDDAIVVGEDAVTLFDAGKSPLEAAVGGAQRMWVPVATSSLTTLAAFIPLLMIGGVMGQVMLALPAVLLCVIIASLIECFLVLPGHLRRSLSHIKKPSEDSFRARFDRAFLSFRDRKFLPLADKVLKYPGATVSAAVGGILIAFSLVASQHVGFAMNIGFDLESLAADVAFSASATDDQKEAFLKHLEDTLVATDKESEQPGNLIGWLNKRNTARLNQERQSGTQYARIEGQYAFEEQRTLSPEEFLKRWREKIIKPPFVEQLVSEIRGGANNGDPDLTMVLSGNSIDTLKAGAEEISQILSSYPGVSNVTDNLPYGTDQWIFSLTPTGRSLGITSASLGQQLRAAYSGKRVQIFNENDSEIEVKVMLPDAERDDIASLQQFPIKTVSGSLVPLANIATFTNRRGIDLIRHTDAKMSIQINADVDSEMNNAMTLLSEMKENVLPPILARHNLTFGLGGKSYQEQVMLETMAVGAMLTLILIYLILTWVFASYLWPLAIMMAIPFGLTGAIFGHWVMGLEISAMSMLAFFSLTGIVVNDSIVLVSFLKREIENGLSLLEALRHSISARFRAVLLTSLTTIAGLMPLAFETSSLAMMTTPIAITICFGLAFATLLVLLVIPALILLLESGKDKILHLLDAKGLLPGQRKEQPTQQEAEPPLAPEVNQT